MPQTELIKEYRRYRRAARELVDKIMKTCLSGEILSASAKMLGMEKKNVLVFDNEDETDILMDFCLHEYRPEGKTPVELYRETKGGDSYIERMILGSWMVATSSLFKIFSVSRREPLITLEDLLSPRKPLDLIDIGLQESASPGYLIFLRGVPFKDDLIMTSGVTFVFRPEHEDQLLGRYFAAFGNEAESSVSIRRFVHFFREHKKEGLEVRYE